MAAVRDSARFDPFDLADAALAGQSARVVRIVDTLREEGGELTLLSWALTREVRATASMAAELTRGQTKSAIFARRRIWSNRKPLYGAALERHQQRRWRTLLGMCSRLDRVVKGAAVGQAWDELLQLALAIAGCNPLQRTDRTT